MYWQPSADKRTVVVPLTLGQARAADTLNVGLGNAQYLALRVREHEPLPLGYGVV